MVDVGGGGRSGLLHPPQGGLSLERPDPQLEGEGQDVLDVDDEGVDGGGEYGGGGCWDRGRSGCHWKVLLVMMSG